MKQEEPLGFEYQPWHEGSCGAYSFGHAMSLVGKPITINEAKKKVRYISPGTASLNKAKKFMSISYSELDTGTYEEWIIGGVKKVGCIPHHYKTPSPDKAFKFLDSSLAKGMPVIMTVNWTYGPDDDGHYMVCAGKKGQSYIVVDSAGDWVVELYSKRQLEDRFVWFYNAEEEPLKAKTKEWYYEFSMTAVDNGKYPTAVKNFGKVFPKLYNDETLLEGWGYYLTDLIDCLPRLSATDDINASEYIRQHRQMLRSSILHWLAETDGKTFDYYIEHYIIVAEAYGFTFSAAVQEEFLSSFIVALIGCLLYDV